MAKKGKLLPGKKVVKKASKKKASKKSAVKKASDIRVKKTGPKADRSLQKLQERVEKQKQWSTDYAQRKSVTGRDIGEFDVDGINWDRRLSCKASLKTWCETYHKTIFYLGWSVDQLSVLEMVERCFRGSGEMFALAMPRGGGKTAICRGGMLWGTLTGLKKFPFFVGSTGTKALQTLEAIKTILRASRPLFEDFPEITYAIRKLEGRATLATGQTYLGNPTNIIWGKDQVRYPSLIIPKDIGDEMLKHDPSCLEWIDEAEGYISVAAGTMIRTAGVDGSIRGEAEAHPVTLSQPRPDIALLDDIQKDQKARSPNEIAKLVELIDGAVSALAGPDRRISVLKPCTIIKAGDVAHIYLTKKHIYRGQIHKLVINWPEGITDHGMDPDSEAGKLWMNYMILRTKSMKKHKDNRLADDFYVKNRSQMDEGFDCSWDNRFDKDTEISPQQAAMNFRADTPGTFAAEFQNNPRVVGADGQFAMITTIQLCNKVLEGVPKYQVPVRSQKTVAFVDIQNEIMFWMIMSSSLEFDAHIVAYGTWPEVEYEHFTKSQAANWSLLTRAYLERHPDQRDKAYTTEAGYLRAELEPKIWNALDQTTNYLKSKELRRADGSLIQIDRIGFDVRWGEITNTAKQFCMESSHTNLLPCYGQSVPVTNKQIQEYQRRPGWIFEDQICRNVKDSKWLVKPDPMGTQVMMMDPDMLKDFLHSRLVTPIGGTGAMTLFDQDPELHELMALHICESEYPELIENRGRSKNQWMTTVERTVDNDWLDTAYGCCALLGSLGCSVQPSKSDSPPKKPKRKLSDLYAQKRANR